MNLSRKIEVMEQEVKEARIMVKSTEESLADWQDRLRLRLEWLQNLEAEKMAGVQADDKNEV